MNSIRRPVFRTLILFSVLASLAACGGGGDGGSAANGPPGGGTAVTLKSLAITSGSSTVTTGSTVAFAATGTFSDGTTKDLTQQLTWTSSSTGVATVASGGSMAGIATGVAGGTASIMATGGAPLTGTAGGKVSATAMLTVKNKMHVMVFFQGLDELQVILNGREGSSTTGGPDQAADQKALLDPNTYGVTVVIPWSLIDSGGSAPCVADQAMPVSYTNTVTKNAYGYCFAYLDSILASFKQQYPNLKIAFDLWSVNQKYSSEYFLPYSLPNAPNASNGLPVQNTNQNCTETYNPGASPPTPPHCIGALPDYVAQQVDTVQCSYAGFAASDQVLPPTPIYPEAGFQANWQRFIGDFYDYYVNGPNRIAVEYLRFGVGADGESFPTTYAGSNSNTVVGSHFVTANPAPVPGTYCRDALNAAGLSTANWTSYVVNLENYVKNVVKPSIPIFLAFNPVVIAGPASSPPFDVQMIGTGLGDGFSLGDASFGNQTAAIPNPTVSSIYAASAFQMPIFQTKPGQVWTQMQGLDGVYLQNMPCAITNASQLNMSVFEVFLNVLRSAQSPDVLVANANINPDQGLHGADILAALQGTPYSANTTSNTPGTNVCLPAPLAGAASLSATANLTLQTGNPQLQVSLVFTNDSAAPGTALNVELSSVSIGSTAGIVVPGNMQNIAPGQTGVIGVLFPSAVASPGTPVTVNYTATYATGGSATVNMVTGTAAGTVNADPSNPLPALN